MKRLAQNSLAIAVAVIACAPLAARAQWQSSNAPQPYAVEVAPGTYVIQRPTAAVVVPAQAFARAHREPEPDEESRSDRHARHKVDRVVERRVRYVREKPVVVVHKRVVDDPPRVILRQHVVTDMPRGRGLFQPPPQPAYVEDLPPVTLQQQVPLPSSWQRVSSRTTWHGARYAGHRIVRRLERKHRRHAASRDVVVRSEIGGGRVVHAQAEVTILGPDRMTIRLYRKGGGKADAFAD